MKTHTTLTCDPENLQRARNLGMNLSAEFNEYLGVLIARKTQNTSAIDLELEKMRLKRLTNKMTDLQLELKACQENITKVEELNAQKQEAALEKEKEIMKKETSCMNCGQPFSEKTKTHKFTLGLICHGCFMSCDKSDIKRWNNG